MSDDVTLTGELEDTAHRPRYDVSRVDFERLVRPRAWPHAAGLAIALLVLFWPDRSEIVVGRLIGVSLLVYGTGALWSARPTRPFPWLGSALALAAVGVGVLMTAAPISTAATIGRVLGAMLVVEAAWNLLTTGRHQSSERGWRVASASATGAVGLVLLAAPAGFFSTATVAIACTWIGVELIALSVILDPNDDPGTPVPDTTTLLWNWFGDRPKTVDDRRRLYGELLYEGDTAQTRVIRFSMLMIFASIIASMGVVSDSTAVVVGAMLIAPLMTPLMAMALSLVMGWPNRLGRSALVALAGILIAIGIGLVIGLAEFTLVDTMTNGQILSRSSPTMVDLAIAVAAGAAGAYGLSRPDVSNSLPGVAIAIALVPPLTVIGISYSQADWRAGNGALLLFLTNAIAILVVGALMFLLLGVAPLSRATENQYRVRTASAAVAGAGALVVGALALNGTSVATNIFEQRATQRVVADWIEPFPRHSTVGINLSGDTVAVVLAGPIGVERPAADELASELSSELGRAIDVDLRVRLEIQETSS
jgi:uncharacterized hydrophobic protein (TIGR00271 family)